MSHTSQPTTHEGSPKRGDYRLVVLVDRDRDDCRALKAKLERMTLESGLLSRARAKKNQAFHILNRVVIEELEAWLIGDTDALRAAYPKLPRTLATKAKFKHPDELDDTWRILERELQRHGYFDSGLAKIECARAVAEHMEPQRNRSPSFCAFRDGLLELVSRR